MTTTPQQAAPRQATRRAAVENVLADLSAGRIDECLNRFTPDVQMSVPFMTAGLTRHCDGRTELGALLRWAAKTFDPFAITVRRSWDLVPDGVAVEYATDAIHKPSGKPYLNSYLGLFLFREDDLIHEWIEYANPIPTLFALAR